jgi:sulfofructose kinase
MTHILTIGIAVLDDIYAIPGRLVPGEKHRARSIGTVTGGTAANAALAIARLGGRASLLTRMGDDKGAATLRAMLEEGGIDLSWSKPSRGCGTSRSTIVIEPDGDRTIVNFLDRDLPEAPEWLPADVPAGVDAVLADVRWEVAARRMFEDAARKGLPRVFDGDRKFEDRVLLDLSTHAIFSAQGLREMTGHEDFGDALRAIAAGRSGLFAVTDGANGTYWLEGRVLKHMPAFVVTAVDTLGAGDVYHGAFALAIGEGQPLHQALRFASGAAAIKCTRPGGGSGAPTRAELTHFLKENAA